MLLESTEKNVYHKSMTCYGKGIYISNSSEQYKDECFLKEIFTL